MVETSKYLEECKQPYSFGSSKDTSFKYVSTDPKKSKTKSQINNK